MDKIYYPNPGGVKEIPPQEPVETPVEEPAEEPNESKGGK